MLKSILTFAIALNGMCFADEVTVCAPNGEMLFVDVDPKESFGNVISRIGSSLDSQTFSLVVDSGDNESKTSSHREYYRENTKEERDHLSFIICTMGFKSLPQVWKERKALRSAGDKIDHLHPLRFTMGIFTDEEMKAAMSNIKGRMFVWNGFKKGLYTSLTEETKNNNMLLEYIEDFAKRVKVDSNLIIRPLQQEKWDEFINVLIKHVPRKGDPKRYDM